MEIKKITRIDLIFLILYCLFYIIINVNINKLNLINKDILQFIFLFSTTVIYFISSYIVFKEIKIVFIFNLVIIFSIASFLGYIFYFFKYNVLLSKDYLSFIFYLAYFLYGIITVFITSFLAFLVIKILNKYIGK